MLHNFARDEVGFDIINFAVDNLSDSERDE
jgi:hypothetical protein